MPYFFISITQVHCLHYYLHSSGVSVKFTSIHCKVLHFYLHSFGFLVKFTVVECMFTILFTYVRCFCHSFVTGKHYVVLIYLRHGGAMFTLLLSCTSPKCSFYTFFFHHGLLLLLDSQCNV
jgi:hypothetical protein